MDYEKKYNEALERAKQVKLTGIKENVAAAEYIFPELKESEDERIRKKLIGIFTNQSLCDVYNLKSEEVIAYLEKQARQNSNDVKREWWNKGYLEGRKNAHIPARELGLPSSWDFQKEQKPIEFKNDELVEIIKGEFEGFRTLLKKKGIDYEPQRSYWKAFARLFDSSAREYVKEQKPVEWSEEDEENLESLTIILQQARAKGISCEEEIMDLTDWLKSLRPHWKPSEEQMRALERAIVHLNTKDDIPTLTELRDNLKKL